MLQQFLYLYNMLFLFTDIVLWYKFDKDPNNIKQSHQLIPYGLLAPAESCYQERPVCISKWILQMRSPFFH